MKIKWITQCLLLIIKLKIHPVLSLLVSSLVIGLGAGMSVPLLASTIESGAGNTLQGIALGASAFSHFNGSGFWLVSSLLKINEKDTLKSWTMMEIIVGLTGLTCALVISTFFA